MRLFNFRQSTFSFYKRVDLLDGQRRGEVLFRRFFVLFIVYAFGYLLIQVYAPNKDVQVIEKVQIIKEVQAVEESCEVEVEVEPEVVVDAQLEAIRTFTQSYGGSRIDSEYFNLLQSACTSNESLRTVVAISVAESGMGGSLPNRVSNFWGWFKGGNRNYDPDRVTMASEICSGIERSYMGIGVDVAKANRYVGYNSSAWLNNFNWAYAQMEVK